MSFRLFWPFIVLMLLVPLGLLAWQWMRSGRNVIVPYDHGRPGSGRWLATLITAASSLPALVLAVVMLILAGPTRLTEPEARRKLTNIQFCVDISGSMTASFGEGNRYDASMKAIDEFLEARHGDAFGLTFFGNEVMHWVPITTDANAIRHAPPFMRPENAPPQFGGTEIGKALIACQRRLVETESGDRMILLVSDGNSFDLGGGNDMQIANQLKENRIVLYAIHIAETKIPDSIVNIASHTGGEAFEPDDVEGLRTVFNRIDTMEAAEMERSSPDAVDHYEPYAITALSLLGVSLLCSFGIRYTPW